MAQPITPPQPLFPHIDSSIDPKITRHIQMLYQALNSHDQAIIAVNKKVTGTTSTASTTTTPTDVDVVPITTGGGVAGVTSFNSMAGDVSFFPSLGAVNDQTLSTFYVTQTTDNGVLIVLNSAAPIPITLNFNVVKPWYTWIANYGAGLATLTPSQGTITYPGNIGAVSMPLPSGFAAYIGFDGTNWWAVAIPISGGGGTISGVIAGTGLTGGGSSGSVTLALDVPVSVVDGGTGTATPGLVAGTNVTITGAWPNQTVNSSGGGGGGVTQIVAGSNVTISPPGGTGAVTINVAGGTTVADHFVGSGATPTIVVGSDTGVGAIASITGRDSNGTFQVTMGTGTSSSGAFSDIATITFAVPYLAPATVVLFPAIGNAATLSGVFVSATTTGFEVRSVRIPLALDPYIWNYLVIGS